MGWRSLITTGRWVSVCSALETRSLQFHANMEKKKGHQPRQQRGLSIQRYSSLPKLRNIPTILSVFRVCCKCYFIPHIPWGRVLLEKLNGPRLVKKFPAFYGMAITSARHLFLSWARSVQSMLPHPTCRRFALILFSHLRLGLPSGLFPSSYPHQNPVYPLLICYSTHFIILYLRWWWCCTWNLRTVLSTRKY
jgi:hypothetical protein